MQCLWNPASASPFSDIPSIHWGKEAVETLAAKGFVTGFSPEVFLGKRPATRYETALILSRLVVFLEKEKPYVPLSVLEELKETLANYQDEIERSGFHLENLENQVKNLENRIAERERIQFKGGFRNRTVATRVNGTLNGGFGSDTTFTDEHLNRPYSIFPFQRGESSTTLGFLQLSSKLSEKWEGGGKVAAYNSVGNRLNGLVWGGTPPFFNNPLEGYPINNHLKWEMDQLFAQTKDETLKGEVGSFYTEYSPPYLYAGVPNLTLEGPDFLPNYGGKFIASMKPYLFISKAYSEFFAGKLAQDSPWQTQLFGANFGVEALGVAVNAHWMTTQNEPSTFAPGNSGLITVPINGGAGWLNPLTLSAIAVGPQKERVWGVDLSVKRSYRDRPLLFKLAYGNSDYKPNTNSSDNAKGELYDLSLEGNASKTLSIGVKYLSVDPKYSPFILPIALPLGITTSNFPWSQWPFPVEFQGYTTLQNAQEYPQNRQGVKTFLSWSIPRGSVSGEIRWLSQKVATQLSLFNNDIDIQSIGFYEPLFTASGAKPQNFLTGRTTDWNLSFHYLLHSPLEFELSLSGGGAKRETADANHIDFNGWLGHAGFIYPFLEKWKLKAAYHAAHADGYNLSSPTGVPNYQFQNSGEFIRIDYSWVPKSNVFFLFKNLNHSQVQGNSRFRLLQFLTGFDVGF